MTRDHWSLVRLIFVVKKGLNEENLGGQNGFFFHIFHWSNFSGIHFDVNTRLVFKFLKFLSLPLFLETVFHSTVLFSEVHCDLTFLNFLYLKQNFPVSLGFFYSRKYFSYQKVIKVIKDLKIDCSVVLKMICIVFTKIIFEIPTTRTIAPERLQSGKN